MLFMVGSVNSVDFVFLSSFVLYVFGFCGLFGYSVLFM